MNSTTAEQLEGVQTWGTDVVSVLEPKVMNTLHLAGFYLLGYVGRLYVGFGLSSMACHAPAVLCQQVNRYTNHMSLGMKMWAWCCFDLQLPDRF